MISAESVDKIVKMYDILPVNVCHKPRKNVRRHDNIIRVVHWTLCKKYELDREKNSYGHNLEYIIEHDNARMLWDFVIQWNHEMENRKLDVMLSEDKM